MRKAPGQRRADLLQAAVRRFSEKGIDHTTVDDIVLAAGVAKGTFYLYFDSKEQIVAALRARMAEESMIQATAFVKGLQDDEPWAIVSSTVESFLDSMLGNRDQIRLFSQVAVTAETTEILAECDRKLNGTFAAGIQAGVDRGFFDVRDAATTAALLRHAIEGTVGEAIRSHDDPDRARLLAASLELARRALNS
ncbi:TetR/AcrR family transcriptional regulator [Candidatus Nephthysia bennettiae]|uniref:TetR/AcrR family transcriptional regulator n=1 Tax=Candidatus Nephthysia bennettiae TaxID=3127016 RepID=A0A934JZV8_9BACT|nr:TetR/AcrR family transcriptional regulator [Candidatus Dormibacteraeota bacterium]